MKDEKKAPKLRFKGFTDDWEQCKLGDVFAERSEKSQDGNEELLSVTLKDGVIKSKSLDRKNTASHDKRNYKLVIPNDIAYNSMRMWQGALGVSKFSGIVSPAYTVIKLRNQLENPYFYQYYFKKNEMLNVFRKNSQGLTSDTWNLKYPLFSRIRFFTASTREQQQISSLLYLLDQTITLHGEKKRQLERLKSALLQKMFADKSGYPAIRFKGFTDDWEQCKLGDVCEEVSGNNGNVKGLPILTISAANGWMNQKDRFSQVIAGNELKKYTLLKKGHLAYNHGNSKQAKYGTVFVQNLYDQALVPRVYHSFKMKTENDPYYVEYYFATKKLDRELARLVTSGARMDGLLNINKKDFFKIKFEVPTPVEQSLIGTILQKLDQTITLHDQKLNLLKLVKQSLLQNMFI